MNAKTRFILRGLHDELESLGAEIKGGGLSSEPLGRVRSAISQARTALGKLVTEDASQRALVTRHLERAAEIILDAIESLDELEDGLEGAEIGDAFRDLGWDIPVSEAAAYYFDLDSLEARLRSWAEELLGARKAVLNLNLEVAE